VLLHPGRRSRVAASRRRCRVSHQADPHHRSDLARRRRRHRCARDRAAGYKADIWYGVVAPAKTPAAVITRLNEEILRGMQSAQVRQKLEADGSDLVANTPAEFASVMRAEHQRWAKVIKAAGLRADD
jgi:hypothetical protein